VFETNMSAFHRRQRRLRRFFARRGSAKNCAQMHVLEAVMIAIMMFVAISFTSSFTLPTYREPYGRRQLESTAADKLQNLYRITPASSADKLAYGNLLMKYVTEAALGNSNNLSTYIKTGLEDAQFNVYLGNGYGRIPIYSQGIPPGDAVSASQIITAPWSYTMVFTDLDVYDSATSTQMTVWALPVYKSSLVKGLSGVPVGFSNGANHVLIEKSGKPGIYEKTGILPKSITNPDGYDTSISSNVRSNLTYRGTLLSGRANYTVLGIGVLNNLRTALHGGGCSLSVSPTNVTLGQNTTITYNFSGLLGISSLNYVEVKIHGPIMSNSYTYGNYSTATGTYNYEIPQNSIYGPYCVEVVASVLFNNKLINARLVDYFVVTLPDGSQPSSPAYDVQLVMWYPEW